MYLYPNEFVQIYAKKQDIDLSLYIYMFILIYQYIYIYISIMIYFRTIYLEFQKQARINKWSSK